MLYIDGEMSRALLKERLLDEEARLLEEVDEADRIAAHEALATNFHTLSTEDMESFQPLNTPAGQTIVNRLIERIGGSDFVIFDNVMSLTAGSMKEEESWAQTQPWVNSLTKKKIGQLWVHHSNDQDKIYGTKTRGWQMGAIILLTKVARDDTDVSFTLKFEKARERTPKNRSDFRDVNICLLDNEWQISDAVGRDCPAGLRAVLDAVNEALIDNGTSHKIENGPTVRAVDVKTARAVHKKRYLHTGEGDRDAAERQAWSRNFKKAESDKFIAGESKDGLDLVWIVCVTGNQNQSCDV